MQGPQVPFCERRGGAIHRADSSEGGVGERPHLMGALKVVANLCSVRAVQRATG
jgi:hypothetical protein